MLRQSVCLPGGPARAGAVVVFAHAVGTAGTEPSRAGPYFFEEIGERTPRGRRFLPLGTPFSGGRNGGRWFRQVGAWPAASKTNASWPAHQLGRAGEVVYCREEKWKPERLLSAFSQRVPRHVPSPPSRWAGRYGPFNVRAAGQVTSEVQPPHTTPPEKGVQREEPLPSGVLSLFLPKKWGPGWASHRSLPFQRRAQRPTMAPAHRSRPFQRRRKAPRNRKPPRFPRGASSFSLFADLDEAQ